VIGELTQQQQYYMQQQQLQQQQLMMQQNQSVYQQQPPRNPHNFNLLQTAFAVDPSLGSRLFAEIMQKILIQRNGEDYMRSVRSLLRETVKNSRAEFELSRFVSELVSDSMVKRYYFETTRPVFTANEQTLFSFAGGLADFTQVQVRERYVNAICDLITVCILVAITAPIKEAYLRRQIETRDILIKYYMCMTQIQCDAVKWLQTTVRCTYETSATELVKHLCKLLFMVDKPGEQYHYIDNWITEQERATVFRVVSEIPVLSETLLHVLCIANTLPDNLYWLMLCIEENLLKTAALVHTKEVYSLRMGATAQAEDFVKLLFNICLYKHEQAPELAVSVLYWKAWQILLIVCALDPQEFGYMAWQRYPTLRLLMEMIIIDDYNYPPQSSITDELTVDKYRAFETQASALERQEILEFENRFELKQGSHVVRTEANSQLIGKVMRYDPSGPPRRPQNDTIQNIKKLNSEYKLGQMLCKCRQPDYLLTLIKRQTSSMSFAWLSSLIESSSNDCLDIMPIQCVCEFVWNLLNGDETNTFKKQINWTNLEQLLQRLRAILVKSDLNDSHTIQQIVDTFEYFLNKLCSDKISMRAAALRILARLFTNAPSLSGAGILTPAIVDLRHLISVFKQLSSFEIYVKPLLFKYIRRILMVETNVDHICIYLDFLFEQLLSDFKQQHELESSIRMELDATAAGSAASHIPIKSESFKSNYNEIAIDLAEFMFKRVYCVRSLQFLKPISTAINLEDNFNKLINEKQKFRDYLIKFASIVVQLNEYELNNETSTINGEHMSVSEMNIRALLNSKQEFNRRNLNDNSYLLLQIGPSAAETVKYVYIHEAAYNLIVYLCLLAIDMRINDRLFDAEYRLMSDSDELINDELRRLMICLFVEEENGRSVATYLNCRLSEALNNSVKEKLLRINIISSSSAFKLLLNKQLNLSNNDEHTLLIVALNRLVSSFSGFVELLDCLLTTYGLSTSSVYCILSSLDKLLRNISQTDLESQISSVCDLHSTNLTYLSQVADTYAKSLRLLSDNSEVGEILVRELNRLKEKFKIISKKSSSTSGLFAFDDARRSSISTETITSSSNSDLSESVAAAHSSIKLTNMQKKINELKSRISLHRVTSKQINTSLDESGGAEPDMIIDEPDETKSSIVSFKRLIDSSTNHDLESNMNKFISEISASNEQRLTVLSECIIEYERTAECTKSSTIINKTSKRCVVDLLLDYMCHFDSQIVNKRFEQQSRLLFELREPLSNVTFPYLFEFSNTMISIYSQSTSNQNSDVTRSFLLSLFVHQANWNKLHECVDYLLNKLLASRSSISYRVNSSAVLDFFSSLIHIPELWKGTECKMLEKYSEENVLNLNESQVCSLIDLIIEESCLMAESRMKKCSLNSENFIAIRSNEPKINEMTGFDEIKQRLFKRIQLLKHFTKSFEGAAKESLHERIVNRVLREQQSTFKRVSSNLSLNNSVFQTQGIDWLKLSSIRDKNFYRIQRFFLYNLYLEENNIIHYIPNLHRLFSDLYHQVDMPTKVSYI
jgi:hypothetical protein